MAIKQKDAVFNAVTATIGTPTGSVTLSNEQRKAVTEQLISGFQAGNIELATQQQDIKKYAANLINNWIRKDPRLNGGSKYAAKNPGSRAGRGDPIVTQLKSILAETKNEDDRRMIEEEIKSRVALLKPEKAKKQIDLSVLPDDLKARLGL